MPPPLNRSGAAGQEPETDVPGAVTPALGRSPAPSASTTFGCMKCLFSHRSGRY
jgi:hypothetical protein